MSFLRRKPTDGTDGAASDEPTADAIDDETPIVGKGRPTPKRREAEGKRGPVAPPPKTQREAMKRSKVAGKSMTKEERRAAARVEPRTNDEPVTRRPCSRGTAERSRAYVRDLVDTRRNIAGILLPIALLSFIILLIPIPIVQAYGPLVLLVAIVAAIIDSVIFGRQIAKKVRAKFPNGDSSGQSTKGSALGFYAFNRACLIRTMAGSAAAGSTRAPRSTDPGERPGERRVPARGSGQRRCGTAPVLRRRRTADHPAGQAVPAARGLRPDRPAVRPGRPVHRDSRSTES